MAAPKLLAGKRERNVEERSFRWCSKLAFNRVSSRDSPLIKFIRRKAGTKWRDGRLLVAQRGRYGIELPPCLVWNELGSTLMNSNPQVSLQPFNEATVTQFSEGLHISKDMENWFEFNEFHIRWHKGNFYVGNRQIAYPFPLPSMSRKNGSYSTFLISSWSSELCWHAVPFNESEREPNTKAQLLWYLYLGSIPTSWHFLQLEFEFEFEVPVDIWVFSCFQAEGLIYQISKCCQSE